MDLKLICAVALCVLIVHFVLVFAFGWANWGVPKTIPQQQTPLEPLGLRDAANAFFSFVIQYIGPAVPIYGIIIGWAYQSASKRLGIIDLFACEISTVCRVGTMFDIGKHYIRDYDAPGKMLQWIGSGKFVSEEDYFPVFDNNSRDLQLLEAAVVENITQFYTYMKALRDLRRKLDAEPRLDAPGAAPGDAPRTDYQRGVIASIIYLLYLGYESAREAVHDLVEFQPDAAERATVILLTELPCYAFLLRYYEKEKDDVRYKRLKLREPVYKEEIPKLYMEVKSSHRKNVEEWRPAEETVSELATRYKDTFAEDINIAVARISNKANEDTLGKEPPRQGNQTQVPPHLQAT
jgi:hypothetical protein